MKFCIKMLYVCMVFFPLLFATEASATNYYVSQQSGDDSDSGNAPNKNSVSGPWKTLMRASQQVFHNGDEVLLHCGERYEGNLDLRVEAGVGQLRVAGFGNCTEGNMPRIDATKQVELIASGGSRHRAHLEFEPGSVVVDGKLLHKGFAQFKVVADPINAGSVLLQPLLPQGTNLEQAQAYVRTRDWLVEDIRFQGGGGGPANLGNYKTQYPIATGVALAITGKEWTLQNDTWIFDTANKNLVVDSVGGTVRVAVTQPIIRVRGNGSVLIEGLQLEFAGQDAIDILIKGSAAVRGSIIVSPARHAINAESVASLYAIDNRINGSGGAAILVGTAENASITRNSIQDTGTFEPIQPSVGAINVARAQHANISQNTLERSSYSGIVYGEGAEVTSNLVVDSCTRLSDCAALYTWQKTPSPNRRSSRVAGNLIVGVYGNEDVKLGYRTWAAGIYLDDRSSAVLLEDNVVAGTRQGIYFHNAFQNRVVRNVTVGDLEESISVKLDMNDPFFIANTNLNNEVTGHVMMLAGKANAISVVRQLRLEPFYTFQSLQFGGISGKNAISWIENTGDYGKPTFSREVEPSQASSTVRNGIVYRNAASMPISMFWQVLPITNGFKISAGTKFLLLMAASESVPTGCKVISTLDSGPLSLASSHSTLFDCGP